MQSKAIITQIKREFWEHKVGFVVSPLVITGIILVLLIAVALYSGKNFQEKSAANGVNNPVNTQQTIDEEHEKNRSLTAAMNYGQTNTWQSFDLSLIANEHPDFFGVPIIGVVYANTALLAVVYFIVMLIYGHSCLFDDRKNRDILFWRSMPVSEASNVLVKLGMLLLLAPLATLALNIVLAFASFIICVIFFSYHGASLAAILLSIANIDIPGKIIILFSQSLLTQLLLVPLFGFILFCSALAKKSPVFISSVIPVILIVIDKVLQSTSPINLKIIDTLDIYWQSLNRLWASFQMEPNFLSINNTYMTFVAALVVGAAFIMASIWLRNNRYEL